jgi:hypothetical protein
LFARPSSTIESSAKPLGDACYFYTVPIDKV